jgi:hypothetical protein
MEFISLNFVKHNVSRQYGKKGNLKSKINNYFGSFIDQHSHLQYGWVDGKVYVEASFGWKMKKELEKLLNKPIKDIRPKQFPKDFKMTILDGIEIKKREERRIRKAKEALEKRKEETKQEFLDVVKNIKDGIPDHQMIGSFDLEFWEHNMDIILEFGWSIIDYNGETQTTHLVVQENLNYENGQFSKNNRFARKDTQIVPLKIAIQRFQDEFLDIVEIIVGHGLDNDFKVLATNGLKLDLDYLDTADIGSVFMGERDKVSLERLLDHLKIKHDDLHNAANDVEYILKAFFELGDL